MNKKEWGGDREGAGRPEIEDKKKGRSIRFSDEEWDAVKEKAKAAEMLVSEYVRWATLEK